MSDSEGQQLPISVYLWIWLLLFVLSAFSYAVDYMQLQGNVALVIDSHFHGSKSRLHRRHLHAHGLGKDVPGIGHSDATFGVTSVDRPYGDRSRLYVCVPPNVLFLLTHFSVTS